MSNTLINLLNIFILQFPFKNVDRLNDIFDKLNNYLHNLNDYLNILNNYLEISNNYLKNHVLHVYKLFNIDIV